MTMDTTPYRDDASAAGSARAEDAYVAGFTEDPGYLDYAKVGPLSAAVLAETNAANAALARFRHGALAGLATAGERARRALSSVSGFRPDQIVPQPSTTHGLTHVMFGVSGTLLVSPAEFPSLPVAAQRASDALGALTPRWLTPEREGWPTRLTPSVIEAALDDSVAAVAVSLVDPRTGFVADLEGIRGVIGDRLLIVDAIQGFGVVDARFDVADVVAGGGQKWLRAGWGTGYLAMGDRARELLDPVLSGFAGTSEAEPWDGVPGTADGASAFTLSNPDLIALARLAAAVEEIETVGVPLIAAAIAERAAQVIDLADEFGLPVASPRTEPDRAGIVVLEPEPALLGTLVASLHNHGVTATVRQGRVRLSVHAGTSAETLGMLRDALISASTLAV
jgi:selenocysteine lyase/cysteine desulfurase